MELFIITIILIVLAIASQRWGVDSRDGIESEEWRRRKQAALRQRGGVHHL